MPFFGVCQFQIYSCNNSKVRMNQKFSSGSLLLYLAHVPDFSGFFFSFIIWKFLAVKYCETQVKISPYFTGRNRLRVNFFYKPAFNCLLRWQPAQES